MLKPYKNINNKKKKKEKVKKIKRIGKKIPSYLIWKNHLQPLKMTHPLRNYQCNLQVN